MRLFATIILAALLCATASAQTLKSLMYNTTNGRVAYNGTNVLTFAANSNSYTPASFQSFGDSSFTMSIVVSDESLASGYNAPSGSIGSGGNIFQIKHGPNNYEWASPLLINEQPGVYFGGTWLTNTNVTNFRTAVGLGNTNNVVFGEGTETNVGVGVGLTNTGLATGGGTMQGRLGLVEGGNVVAVLDGDGAPFFGLYQPITFQGTNATANVATTRTNLGLGGGITATNTFVSYNGTNYTTNSVTILNGIITGWTQ